MGMLTVLLGTPGCTVLLSPGEQQCQTDKDCTARGFTDAVCTAGVCEKMAVDPVWGCLGHVVEPAPDPSKKVTITEKLTHLDQSPVTMATVDVCSKLDLNCTGTDPNYPKGLAPAADGSVTFSVIQGFDGFIRVTGQDLMDSRVFVGRPVVTPPAVKSVRVIMVSEYGLLAGFAHQMVDATRGTAILYAVDCQGLAASGVTFESPSVDAKSAPFYLINQQPVMPPTATATDVDGFGGIFNMPMGNAVAQSKRAKDGVLIGESSFQVLANTISYVQIAPTPM